ncbi:MAG: 30S ribosomal protein S1 [Planctomycetes bacterium]|nr:30S ribosomal protein S1 [Planctomycetota bacterium]
MSGADKDPLKRYLPSDEEIEKAMEAAMRDVTVSGVPDAGPSFQIIRANTLARGTVIMVQRDTVVVDLSYKAEGVIPLDEYGDAEPSPGDEVEAWVLAVENKDGQVALSIQEGQRQKVWESVRDGATEGAILRGKITEAVKGGCVVDVGMRAFMPARECDIRFVEDLETLVGLDVEVQVIEADREERKVVVSRRAVLSTHREEKKGELFKNLEVGQTRTGVVTNITDFGAFVDIGGADGLIHKGDLAWGHVEKVEEVVQLNQQVEVVVTKFDRQAERIGLSLKQAGPSPWDHASVRYAPGTRTSGRVVGLLDFGAIVELEVGIQGLVHVSEMRWGQRVSKPQDVVELGQPVNVEVLSLDLDRCKISLSMRKVEENPWATLEQNYPFATVVEGTVSRLEDFGAFIELEDGIEGLVHVSELSWTERVSHPREKVSVGDAVTAIVIGNDTDRQRLSLSIRKTEPDPWWDVDERFPAGKTVQGTVVRMKDFGAFVEVATGLEALVHVSNMGFGPGTRPRDVVKIGNIVQCEVMEASEESRRIGLRLIEVIEGEDA